MTLIPDIYTGYELLSVSVTAEDGSTVTAVWDEETGAYTFVMPASGVTVSGQFREIQGSVDKSGLEDAILRAGDILENLDQYVNDEEAKQVFKDALDGAKAVYGREDASQEEVDEAEAALTGALDALQKKADKSGLEQLVKELRGIDLTKYTEESGRVLSDALAEAEELLGKDLAESEQQLITDMIEKLNAAKEQLVPVKEEPENPGGGDAEDPDRPQNPGGSGGQGGNSGQGGNAGSSAPSTGDSTPVMAAGVILLLSGSMLAAAAKRKK